jgi:D-alanine-D-alanine ligase
MKNRIPSPSNENLDKRAKTCVALLVGGWSVEREVSLTKGKEVEKALKEAGYQVRVVDVKRDITSIIENLSTPSKPDVVFNNLHGRGGEDGMIQSVLEMLEIPYTHSGVMASALGMDKVASKQIAASVGVQSPRHQILPEGASENDITIPKPYVIKPANEGSSVDITIVHEGDNDSGLHENLWQAGRRIMVEEFIAGEELTVAVLDGRAQAVTAIKSQNRFFDYEAKYADGRTTYEMPARIDSVIYDKALRWAEHVYNALGCGGMARCDFRYDPHKGDDGLYFLEINTQPGFTAESIGPSQAIMNGYTFPELCAHLVETARLNG